MLTAIGSRHGNDEWQYWLLLLLLIVEHPAIDGNMENKTFVDNDDEYEGTAIVVVRCGQQQ